MAALKSKPLPSQAYLQEALEYDPETGLLHWRFRPLAHFISHKGWATWNARFAGKEAFTCLDSGYYTGAVGGTRYKAHRLIWKMVHGTDPVFVDHKDGDGSNNALFNLRAATNKENNCNSKKYRNCISPFKGVTWSTAVERWMAQIRIDGRTKFLGHFDTEIAAFCAYCIAASEAHGEFANFGLSDELLSELRLRPVYLVSLEEY